MVIKHVGSVEEDVIEVLVKIIVLQVVLSHFGRHIVHVILRWWNQTVTLSLLIAENARQAVVGRIG